MRRTDWPLPDRPYRHGNPGRPVDIDLPADRATQIAYGADLFERGAWWESHVAWEAAWHTWPRDAPEALALKGLIQAAAMQLKQTPDLARAHRRLRDRSAFHLTAAVDAGLPSFHGVALAALVPRVRVHAQGDPPLQLPAA
jgi:hypothetical protein